VEDVPELAVNESFTVRATVVSASPDADVAVLRYGFSDISRKRMTIPLISETDNGDGTFTRVFELMADIQHEPGLFHAGVMVVSKKTLYTDDVVNYSSSWWGIPYRVQ
jgi:hypothetical protein